MASAADGCPTAPLRPTADGQYPSGCRVYEKISPADKGSGEIAGGSGLVTGFRGSPSGDSVLYTANSVFLGATSFFNVNAFFGWRAGGTWKGVATTAVLPQIPSIPLGGQRPIDTQWNTNKPLPVGLARDGRTSVYGTNRDPATGALVKSRLYKVDLVDGTYERLDNTPLAEDVGVDVRGLMSGDGVVAGSHDFSTVAFAAVQVLLPGLPSGGTKVYVHRNGQLELGSVAPDGALVGGELLFENRNTVSENGQVLFWSSVGSSSRLFRRDLTTRTTVAVDASEVPGAGPPSGRSSFAGATPDGSQAFFLRSNTTSGAISDPLVPGAPANALYRYTHSSDPESDANLTLITKPFDPSPTGTLNVQSDAVHVSQDGSTVYFWASGPRLTADAPNGPDALYRWRDGDLRFIVAAPYATYRGGPRGIFVAANGRYLAFDSTSDLTGHGGPTNQAQRFVYSDEDGSLSCASCPADRPPTTDVVQPPFMNQFPIGASVVRNYVSTNGEVFFETDTDLLPHDNNGVRDVYVYQHGKLRLITSGRNPDPQARFVDASEDGSTVFFVSRERLSAWDDDDDADLYAARVDGGLPEPTVATVAPCAGDSCQPRTPQPVPSPIPTVSFVGTGNLLAPTSGNVSASSTARVRGTSVKVRARVPGRGAVRVSGKFLRQSVRFVGSASRPTLRVRLTSTGQRSLRRRGRLVTTARIRFQPVEGTESRKNVRVTFLRPAKKSKSRASKSRSSKSNTRKGR